MALTRREMEEINEQLQVENHRLQQEVERLSSSLTRANEQLAQHAEQFTELNNYVQRLRAWAKERVAGSLRMGALSDD